MIQGDLFGKPKPKPVGNFPGTYLFFDTETTGLPKNWNAPVTDLQNWPRLVQLAFVYFKDGFEVESKDYIIKPEGFVIPDDVAKVHGINTQMANEKGVALQIALNEFASLLERADFVVAHNMSFDEKIIGAEFLRKNMINYLDKKQAICTKEISTNFCAIPSSSGFKEFKWPKLSELHTKLFGADFANSHNAFGDVIATAKCFWEMKNRGII
jgi:DNA polymerase III epsilon subunit-like protein